VSDGLGIAGAVLGVLGLVVAVVTYRLSRRDPALKAAVFSRVVVDPGTEGAISVRWHDVEVPRVVQTTARIWNSGSATLKPEHVPDLDQVRLVLPEGDVPLAVTVSAPSPANEAGVEVGSSGQGNEIPLGFLYLDPGQEIVLTVIHTSSSPLPRVSGTVMGAGAVGVHKNRTVLYLVVSILPIPYGFAALAAYLEAKEHEGAWWAAARWGAFGSAVAIFVGTAIWQNRCKARNLRLSGREL
jgi:hypothetical protein